MGPSSCGASQDMPKPRQVAVAAAKRRGHPPPAGPRTDDADHPALPTGPEATAC